MKISSYILLGILLVLSIGCVGPYKEELMVDIESNETAFLVPLEGANKDSQGTFMSIDYLNNSKIASKRIILPQREVSTGRMYYSYKWIPTMRVIKVDRTPVTREWTSHPVAGTTAIDDIIMVESEDSIGFKVGINITCNVKEEDASKFLYYYPGKNLGLVMDTNVRGAVASFLSKEFGTRPLERCKREKGAISTNLMLYLADSFADRGVTISTVGIVGGLSYENPEIQTAINNAYVAEMKVKEKEQNKLAQDQVNQMNVAMAKAEADAAIQFGKAIEERTKQVTLEIAKMKAEAGLVSAQKWDGKLPSQILPANSPLLFNLGASNP